MIQVVMMDERYASIGQLMDLKSLGNYDAMRYLLKNYKYSRYAISMWYRVLSDGTHKHSAANDPIFHPSIRQVLNILAVVIIAVELHHAVIL